MNEPKDHEGKIVSGGAKVRLLFVTEELISGLPESDKSAIQAIVGKELTVESIDDRGNVELNFEDQEKTIHFIWVHPSALQVISHFSKGLK